MSIHTSAIIDPKAKIADDVQIGPFCTVGPDVVIGAGCVLHANVHIKQYTTIGEGCTVHSGAVIGDLPQDLGFDAATVSYTKIGSHCTLREGFTVHRGTAADSITEIGSHCYLMANSHVAHNCVLGDHVIMANGALLGGHVHIGEQTFVGGAAMIHQFVRIGRLAMVGGGSGVGQNVPPFCTTRPMAPNDILGLNVLGMKRAGLSPDERKEIKQIFMIIFKSGLNTTQAIAQCREKLSSPLVEETLQFIEASKRGICGYSGS